MSSELYAVVSNKRGVLYLGDNERKRDEVLANRNNEEELSCYLFERGHDCLFLEMIRKGKSGDFISFNDESVIQALKSFI